MNNKQLNLEQIKQKIELFLNSVRRFWLIMLIAAIIGGTLGGLISRATYTPEYTVTQAFTIKLYEHPETNNASIKDSQLSSTIPSLLSSDTFMDYMFPYIKQADAIGKFKVTSLSSTNIFYLTVSARTNDKCLKIIELIQKHYGELARHVIGESEIEYFTEPAVSALPSNAPNYAQGVMYGALASFLLIVLILALKAFTTRVVSSPDEAEEITKSKCLAVFNTTRIKRRSNDKKGKYKMLLITSEACELDLLQSSSTLAGNVASICKSKGYKSILFTSTISGEGKSSISINLALALAERGNRVVIVDADLRTPSVANYLEISSLNGLLSNVIKEKCKLSDALTEINTNLFVLGDLEHSEGAFEESTSKVFSEILKSLEAEYDYVIVDAAPVGILGEAISIAEAVDSFIYVISHNYINQRALLRGLSSLDSASAKMLGCVINYKK